jgi:hypothetical protein
LKTLVTEPEVAEQRRVDVAIGGFNNIWTLRLLGPAAQFVTSSRPMDLLEERVGRDFATKNIEVVLKLTVVDGKTGAPSIQAIHVW